MQIKILCIAKKNEAHYSKLADEYLQRLKNYGFKVDLQVMGVKPKSQNFLHNCEEENKVLCQAVISEPYIIGLDEKGVGYTSQQFAKNIQQWMNTRPRICFVIGGAYGLNQTMKDKCHHTICLSQLTFPHQLARLVLSEQLYRAATIIRGEPYHH